MNVVDPEAIPQIGQIVRVLRGRDADKLAIVVAIEDGRFVRIADGDKRKFDSSKKKNILHLECVDFISSEVQDSISQTGRVTNGKIRFAINKFKEVQEPLIKEGD
ncbi:KOW domain-containing RNA-binding protein [Caldalkalibacillus mannanilyticus]|uniref:KOW domain-containing RNA-binding protein n=1 Tax=Caldalkalibacillus mannanilyticus TaxID=1418 RepID=UPI000469EE24|nr:KOW domain-containing RNA-binding protein [Caldalkalibacillus mannanilyticus]